MEWYRRFECKVESAAQPHLRQTARRHSMGDFPILVRVLPKDPSPPVERSRRSQPAPANVLGSAGPVRRLTTDWPAAVAVHKRRASGPERLATMFPWELHPSERP